MFYEQSGQGVFCSVQPKTQKVKSIIQYCRMLVCGVLLYRISTSDFGCISLEV